METIYEITRNLWEKYVNWMKDEKNMAKFLVCCFVLSLLPILALSFFNHPVMDDFNYGILTRHALEENSGLAVIPAVLRAAVQRAENLWHEWQGTYSFAVIGALRPSIISERLTFIQTFILVGVMVVGFTYFIDVMLHRILGMSRAVAVSVSVVVLTLCIQYVPVGLEAFYWWIGSVGYTGFFSMLLILMGLIADGMHKKQISAKRMVGMILILILLGGGMYPNALLTAVLMFLLFLDAIVEKKRYPKKLRIQLGSLFIVYLPAFFLNVLAPGNYRRQSNFQPRTPMEAIYKSYTKSLDYMFNEATNVVIVLVIFALFLVMLWQLKNTKFSFRCPLMFTLVSYSLVVVMWVPAIFAVRFISGGRYYNICFYGVILFYASNAIYYAGWLRRQYEKCAQEVQDLLRKATPVLLGVAGVCCVIVGMWKINIVSDLEEITFATALKSMVYGEAQVYDNEIRMREKLYHDPDVKEVVVEEVTYRPELLYFGTLTPDPDDSRNLAMCDYYHKDYMVKHVEEEESSEEDSDAQTEDTENANNAEDAESAE